MISVFRNAWIVTQNSKREILRGDLVVDGEKIIQVGGTFNGTGDEEYDCTGNILLPGFINTHTHIAMTVMKGVVDDMSFPDFLNKTFSIDADRTPEDISIGTKIGCMEMMASATTTFVDLYYDEDIIADATQETGMRGVCSWCCLDVDKTTQKGKPLDNAYHFYKKYKNQRKILPAIGLQGVYCCDQETCMGVKEFADKFNVPLNMHISETKGEVLDHIKLTGQRPIEWLAEIGALTPHMTGAHCNWLTPNEMGLLSANGVNVSTCPASNMKLASGVCPIPSLAGAGVNVSLGTDGSTTNNTLNMIAEMRLVGLMQKINSMDPTVAPAQYLLDLATINGAKAIGMENKLGSLEVGKYADVVVVNGMSPGVRPLLRDNMIANIAYSLTSDAIMTVMCQGDIIYHNHEYTQLNQYDVLSKAEDMWSSLCIR